MLIQHISGYAYPYGAARMLPAGTMNGSGYRVSARIWDTFELRDARSFGRALFWYLPLHALITGRLWGSRFCEKVQIRSPISSRLRIASPRADPATEVSDL